MDRGGEERGGYAREGNEHEADAFDEEGEGDLEKKVAYVELELDEMSWYLH